MFIIPLPFVRPTTGTKGWDLPRRDLPLARISHRTGATQGHTVLQVQLVHLPPLTIPHPPIAPCISTSSPDEGHDLNQRGEGGITILMEHAATNQDGKEISDLIRRGAYVDQVDYNQRTPLMWATIYGNLVGVQTLLDHGANGDDQDEEGKTALIHLMATASEVNFEEQPEHFPIVTEVMRTLFAFQVDLDIKCDEGQTALMYAIIHDFKELAILLLQAGADTDTQDNEGWTALMHVINQNNGLDDSSVKYFVELLLHHQANLNIDNHDKRTALSMAVQDRTDIATLLLSPKYLDHHSQEALSHCDNTARNALHYAIVCEQSEIAKTLSDAGADINAMCTMDLFDLQGLLGWGEQNEEMQRHTHMNDQVTKINALMYSVLVHNDAHVELERLLGAGMEVNASTSSGLTVLMCAAAQSRKNSCQILLQHHADPNTEEAHKGLTPLMFAAHAGSIDCVDQLLTSGADCRAADKEGRNAEAWAKKTAELLGEENAANQLACLSHLQYHEAQRSMQDCYHGGGLCHRTKETTQDCCRQTLSSSRCCDHPATIGSGPAQTPSEAMRRKNRQPLSRACESCEICLVC